LLADKSIGLKISIMKDSPVGMVVFSETYSLLTNAMGLINLSVGTGYTLSGSIDSIDWGNGNYFMRVDADRDGGSHYEFMGTSQLLSVPYALYAERSGSENTSAGSYWKKEGDNLYYNNGNVGIGINNPDRKFQVVGNAGEGQSRDLVLIRNLSSASSAYTGLNLRADDYDYGLGISFTSSGYNLIEDLHGSASIMTNGRAMAISATSSEGSIRLFTNRDEYGIVERMRIDAAGNIGIGTKYPAAKVEVADGDIYISDINRGIIMTSPDGQCWRGTLDNSGTLQFAPVGCP
jgi:hypothetical protein